MAGGMSPSPNPSPSLQDGEGYKRPFLSVITKHMMSRPGYFGRNQESLRIQTDADYEQIVLVDEECIGVGESNVLFSQARPRGEYVLVLDDDDVMVNVDGIRLMKIATATGRPRNDRPAGVIMRGDYGELGVLPDNGHWGQRPAYCNIGMFGFALRRDVFEEFRHLLELNQYTMDFVLIDAVYGKYGEDFVWLDEVICKVLRRSFGRAEDDI